LNVTGVLLRVPSEFYNDRKKAATWLVTSIIFGLVGLAMALGALKKEFALSTTLLGYALAAVVTSVLILFANQTMRKALEQNQQLPTWPFKTETIKRATLILLGLLLVSLVLISLKLGNIAAEVGAVLAALSIGGFLLLGIAALAIAEIQKNIFGNLEYLIRLKRQLDARLYDQQYKIERETNDREDERDKALLNQKRIQEEIDHLYLIYEEAYHLGWSARILHEERLIQIQNQYAQIPTLGMKLEENANEGFQPEK
jgi:hypothetical protein